MKITKLIASFVLFQMTDDELLGYEDYTKPLAVEKPNEVEPHIARKFTLGSLYNLGRQMEIIHEDIMTICPKWSLTIGAV